MTESPEQLGTCELWPNAPHVKGARPPHNSTGACEGFQPVAQAEGETCGKCGHVHAANSSRCYMLISIPMRHNSTMTGFCGCAHPDAPQENLIEFNDIDELKKQLAQPTAGEPWIQVDEDRYGACGYCEEEHDLSSGCSAERERPAQPTAGGELGDRERRFTDSEVIQHQRDFIERLQTEIREARQALWECLKLAGGDTDGDETPSAVVFGLNEHVIDLVRELREAYDDNATEPERLESRATPPTPSGLEAVREFVQSEIGSAERIVEMMKGPEHAKLRQTAGTRKVEAEQILAFIDGLPRD